MYIYSKQTNIKKKLYESKFINITIYFAFLFYTRHIFAFDYVIVIVYNLSEKKSLYFSIFNKNKISDLKLKNSFK